MTSKLIFASLLFSGVALAMEFPPVPHSYSKSESKRGAEKLMQLKKPVATPKLAFIGPCPVTFEMKLEATAPASVTLGWNASPSTNVDGYYILTGSSPTLYTNRTDAGTNLTLTLSVVAGQDLFFVCQAYNSVTNSEFSNVLEFRVPSYRVMNVRTLASPSLDGPWADTGTVLSVTNPVSPLFFKLGISQ